MTLDSPPSGKLSGFLAAIHRQARTIKHPLSSTSRTHGCRRSDGVTVVNVVKLARQIQRCGGSGQMYSVTEQHQSPDPARARYLIHRSLHQMTNSESEQHRVTVVNIVNVVNMLAKSVRLRIEVNI